VLATFPKGVLPVEGGYFGANLIAYILDQYHQAQVTESGASPGDGKSIDEPTRDLLLSVAGLLVATVLIAPDFRRARPGTVGADQREGVGGQRVPKGEEPEAPWPLPDGAGETRRP